MRRQSAMAVTGELGGVMPRRNEESPRRLASVHGGGWLRRSANSLPPAMASPNRLPPAPLTAAALPALPASANFTCTAVPLSGALPPAQLTLRQCGKFRHRDGVDFPHPARSHLQTLRCRIPEISASTSFTALGQHPDGVHTDGGNAHLHQLEGHIGGGHSFFSPGSKMTGWCDDDSHPFAAASLHHLRGDVQRHQHPAHLTAAVHSRPGYPRCSASSGSAWRCISS